MSFHAGQAKDGMWVVELVATGREVEGRDGWLVGWWGGLGWVENRAATECRGVS